METFIAINGTQKAVVEYRKMKSDTANYYVDWIQMYFLSEKLLSLKRYEEARIIAENNIVEFPERDLIVLSMANTYLALNRKEDAIKFYEKTLKLNPENEEAKNRLKELYVK